MKSLLDWNVLLRDTRDVGRAKELFERMSQWNVISWNTMLKLYAHAGDLVAVGRTFERMPQRDIVSWNTIILVNPASFQLMPMTDLVSINSILQAYVNCECFDRAHDLFLGFSHRNIFTWTIAIAAAGSNFARAVRVFNLMPDWDTVSWNSALSAAAHTGEPVLGSFFLSSPPLKDSVSWNIYVTASAARGFTRRAHELLNRMPRHSTVCWNALITACVEKGEIQRARELFCEMRHRDCISWNAMVMAGDSDHSKSMFDRCPMWSTASWNSLITANALNGQDTESLKLFGLMQLQGLKPEERTFAMLLDSCAALTSYNTGLVLQACVEESGMERSTVVSTALMSMHGSCGHIGEAESVFIRSSRVEIVCWNAMLSALAMNGEFGKAGSLFHELLLQGVRPMSSTFTILLTMCSHSGLWSMGLDYFVSMSSDFEQSAWEDQFVCMVDLFGRGGGLAEAKELLDLLPFDTDDTAWCSFLGAWTNKQPDKSFPQSSNIF